MRTLKLTTTLVISVLVISVLALPACGTLQSARSGSNPVAKPSEATLENTIKTPGENAPVLKPANPVTRALRKDARVALDKGDMTGATRLLERALRIDARDADTYLMFARLRTKQGNSRAALQLIDKGLSLRPAEKTARALHELRQSIEATVVGS